MEFLLWLQDFSKAAAVKMSSSPPGNYTAMKILNVKIKKKNGILETFRSNARCRILVFLSFFNLI